MNQNGTIYHFNMIERFRGKYGFLSNFAEVDVTMDGLVFPSVEHAYIAAKSDDMEWKKLCAEGTYEAGALKKISKGIEIVDDWDNKRRTVMIDLLYQKYNQEPYLSMLLDTGDEEIQEGNYWNDKYWGVCLKTNEGENILGKIIMHIRNDMKLKYE